MIRVNLLVSSPGASQPRVLVSKEQRPAMLGLTMLLVTGLGIGGWWYYIISSERRRKRVSRPPNRAWTNSRTR